MTYGNKPVAHVNLVGAYTACSVRYEKWEENNKCIDIDIPGQKCSLES